MPDAIVLAGGGGGPGLGPGVPHQGVLPLPSASPPPPPQAVEDFLFACENNSADFHYAIVPQDAVERAYPGARKTFVRVVDGTFTGGSVMLFNPAVVDRVRTFVDKVIAARKKPWLLAQVFGWSVVMKFASGRPSIAEMQRSEEHTSE